MQRQKVTYYFFGFRKVVVLDKNSKVLGSNEVLEFDIWIRAGETPTSKAVNFVFYYEPVESSTTNKIRSAFESDKCSEANKTLQ